MSPLCYIFSLTASWIRRRRRRLALRRFVRACVVAVNGDDAPLLVDQLLPEYLLMMSNVCGIELFAHICASNYSTAHKYTLREFISKNLSPWRK